MSTKQAIQITTELIKSSFINAIQDAMYVNPSPRPEGYLKDLTTLIDLLVSQVSDVEIDWDIDGENDA